MNTNIRKSHTHAANPYAETVRTPRGYRRLRRNEKRRVGDRIWSMGNGPWKDLTTQDRAVGERYWPQFPHHHYPVIRVK